MTRPAAPAPLWLATVIVCACDPNPAAPRAAPTTPVDKAQIFGDASMVPTRSGERARNELALAGELQRLLDEAGLGPSRVSYSSDAPPRAALVLPASTRGDAEVSARQLARAVLPPSSAITVTFREGEVNLPRSGRPASDTALWFALLALGISVGVSWERWRR